MFNLKDSRPKRVCIIGMMVCIFVLSLTGCYKFNEWFNEPNDWWGEQFLEEVVDDGLKYETGINFDLDFTPSSSEKAK